MKPTENRTFPLALLEKPWMAFFNRLIGAFKSGADGHPAQVDDSGPAIVDGHLRLRPRKQRGSNLCWAACIESYLDSRHLRRDQSEIARQVLACPPPGCSVSVIKQRDCNRALKPCEVTDAWHKLDVPGVRYLPGKGIADLTQLIVEEIQNGRPVQAWVQKAHAILIIGIRVVADGDTRVWLMDPHKSYIVPKLLSEVEGTWAGFWVGIGK